MAATETVPRPEPVRRADRRLRALLDAVLVAGVAAVLVFPILAKLAADRLPCGAPALLAPLPADARPAALRDLPVGLKPGATPAGVADLQPAAANLLGERRATRLLELVRTGATGAPRKGVYPKRYPTLEPLLSGLPATLSPPQVEAATDLGARLLLLETKPAGRAWAAPAAFALLDRAREGGACAPALDLLLLVVSDVYAVGRIVAREGERARRACPGDPTPGWLLGQYQSTIGLPGIGGDSAAYPEPGLATFERLVREHPGSAAAWAGQADGLVRIAATTPPHQPWVARHLYERALAGYRRAARLSPGVEADMGVARALAGLGRADEAVAPQRRAVAALPSAPLPQAQLVVYLEEARRFAEAAAAAERLLELAGNEPAGPGLFPDIPMHTTFEHEHAHGLISLGAGRFAPLSVRLIPPGPVVSPPASVEDMSFIPLYRPSPGVTGSDRWCADWSRRRDLILAGRPAEALSGLPVTFEALPGHSHSCAPSAELYLTGIAQLELGDRPAVVAQLAFETGIGHAGAQRRLGDERQNLWRWAGDLRQAERAARDWLGGAPRAGLPMLRLAEIEFLRGRYDDAARDFGAAARRARERANPDAALEARAMLDRGAALAAGGRRDEAVVAFREADDVASRAALALFADDLVSHLPAVATSYYARVQLAEAARESDALPAAAEAYAAARERVQALTDNGEEFHIEQLENNSAIVDVALGRARSGLAAARRALAVDPENPALLMTAGFAAERAGDPAEAIRLNRAALTADVSAYPAANDLGVLLARRGDDDAAVAALRRAVGAEPRYALGWFNLGVVLAGMGPGHLLSSQGALARAFTLDPALRDREREPTIDAKTYRTGLDVSRPLPPEWSFAASQRQAPAKTVGLAALLMAAFTLSRTLGSRGSGRSLAETWLAPLDRATGRMTFLRRLGHPAIAIVATLLVFVAPLARDPGGGATAAVAGVLGLCVLLAVALRGRSLAARREPELERQRTWPPGVAFGLGGAAAGVAWAPLPVLGSKATPRLHWAAPAALAVVAVPLVIATVWSDIPLTRSLAAAALVMAASLLTPVKPVDGGAIAAAGGTAAGLTGIALAAVLALGLV
jgi:tetratricopeptide (TPR) repeat protein